MVNTINTIPALLIFIILNAPLCLSTASTRIFVDSQFCLMQKFLVNCHVLHLDLSLLLDAGAYYSEKLALLFLPYIELLSTES